MTYLILRNKRGYLAPTRYEKFKHWNPIIQLLFVLICWVTDLMTLAVIPLVLLPLFGIAFNFRRLLDPHIYWAAERLEHQWAYEGIHETFNLHLVKGFDT